MGTAEVRGVFAGGAKAHDLIVSTHQMCVLLLFNDADALTFSEIAEATRVPRDELRRSLQSLSLVKGRNVLRKDPPTKRVEESDTFHFNDAFSSKLMRVKIGTVSAGKESEPAAEKTRARVDDDRKPQIEAAIVRVMKARRALDHNGVVREVTQAAARGSSPTRRTSRNTWRTSSSASSSSATGTTAGSSSTSREDDEIDECATADCT